MLDGLKILVKNLKSDYLKFIQDKLSFGSWFDLETGEEVIPEYRGGGERYANRMIWRKATYKHFDIMLGWKISPFTKRGIWHLKISGSIHRFARDGHNNDLFSPSEAIEAIHLLCCELKIDKKKAKIISLEIGLNIPVEFVVRDHFSCFLLRYKNKKFENLNGVGFIARLAHHSVKAYAKEEKKMRYELVYHDMQELRDDCGINYLSDLNEAVIIQVAEEKLLPKWNNVVLSDVWMEEEYLPSGLDKSDERVLLQYSNDRFLDQIKKLKKLAKEAGNTKEYERLRKKDLRARKKFTEIKKKYGDKSHSEIFQKMVAIMDEINSCPKIEASSYIQIGDNKENDCDMNNKYNNANMDNKLINSGLLINNIKMDNAIIKKSKKAIAKEKREALNNVHKSFYSALDETIKKIEHKQAA